MRVEKVIKCAVFYVLEGDTRVRTFPSEEIMDRWINKFYRDNEGRQTECWIDIIVKDFKNLEVRNRSVTLVRWGE